MKTFRGRPPQYTGGDRDLKTWARIPKPPFRAIKPKKIDRKRHFNKELKASIFK